MSRSPHALPAPEYRLAPRVGSIPTPRVVMPAGFPWRQGMLCGDGIASVKFSLPEQLLLQGHIAPDHVHVMISIPPHVTISRLVQRMQGKSSYRLLAEFPHMRKRFWGRHGWARGYFCRSSGNVTDEGIKAYIAQQSHDSDDVLRIEGEASPSGDTPLGDSLGEEPPPRL